jgi:hypothetical protein
MAGDDRYRNAEQTQSPGGKHGGLLCKEQHCHWQQHIEEQATEEPYQ